MADMMDALLEYLFKNWPIGISIVVVTWFAARLYTRLTQTEKECASNSEAITGLRNDGDRIQTDLNRLVRAVDEVRAFIAARSSKGAHFFSGKHSPRKLNASGERLMRDACGEAFLQMHKDRLFALLDERKPQTAFDVEVYANEVLLNYSSDPAFNGLKYFLYNYPDMEVTDNEGKKVTYSVTLEDICFVLSLRLRDMYLEAHPALLSPPVSVP